MTHLTSPPSFPVLSSFIHTLHTAKLHYPPPPPPPPPSRDPSFPNTSPAQRTAIRTVLPAVLFFHPPHTQGSLLTNFFQCLQIFSGLYVVQVYHIQNLDQSPKIVALYRSPCWGRLEQSQESADDRSSSIALPGCPRNYQNTPPPRAPQSLKHFSFARVANVCWVGK